MTAVLSHVADPLIEHVFREIIVDALRLVPNVVAAIVVFVVAAEVGSALEGVVERAVGRTSLGTVIDDSPMGEVLPDGGVGAALGTAVRYYVLLVALLVIANTLGLVALLGWLAEAARYVPALAGGLLVLVFGVVAVDRLTRGLEGGTATAVGVVLYAAVGLIALETMGAGTGIAGQLLVFAVGAAVLAAAIAVGLGGAIAIGLGSREYVAATVDGWLEPDGGDAGED